VARHNVRDENKYDPYHVPKCYGGNVPKECVRDERWYDLYS
jgi:hypothetical protein